MKSPIVAIAVALSLAAAPGMAQSFDLGNLTPTLDFPEPSSEPVSKDNSGINK